MNPFKGGLGDMWQQAAKFKEDLQKIQEELKNRTTEASAGGGMVKVCVNGKQQLLSITIDPEVLKMNDLPMLQDLIVAGVNEALKASQEMAASEMGKLTAGLGPVANLLKGL